MSAVLMCDNCGEMFSVNQNGWKEFKEEWNHDRETFHIFNNSHNHGAITRHIGPCCSLVGGTPKPRIAIENKKDN